MENISGNTNYYLAQKPKLLKAFNTLLKAAEKVLITEFDENTLQTMLYEMRTEFVSLIPRIPYIGGNKNVLTQNLTICAQYLPICKILKKYNMNLEQMRDAVRTICETQLNTMPWLQKSAMRFLWKLMFTKWFKQQMQKTALQSQTREYQDNFVYELVEGDGDGKRFDFGYNFTACAVCNFFQQENALEFVPLMCELDYVLADFVKVKLVRTSTLAKGGKCCDFRYSRN